jgi:hypothetical protein
MVALPRCIAPLVLAVVVLHVGTSSAAIVSCRDWFLGQAGEYQVENNVWGKGNITAYEQCVAIEPVQDGVRAGWSWNWPVDDGGVKAYPEVIFGWKPWFQQSTTVQLPIRIDRLESARVAFDVQWTTTGVANLAFDCWVTSGWPPTPQNRTRELMIWLDNRGIRPGGDAAERVVIGRHEFDLYISQRAHTYVAFVATSPLLAAELDIGEFLAHLVGRRYVAPTEWLASVELGNEIKGGYGQTVVERFSVRVQAAEGEPQGLQVNLSTNRSAFRQGDVHVLSVALSNGSAVAADSYVLVKAPGGALFSLVAGLGLVPGVQPYLANVVLPAGLELSAHEIFRGPLPSLPPGEYTWLYGFTRPGTQELVSNVAQAAWIFE